MKLAEIYNLKTGKLNSNAAVIGGIYPFFTCSPEILAIDSCAFDEEAILLAGNNANAKFNIKYFTGKFNAYQRTYIINSKDSSTVLTRYLYFALSTALEKFSSISAGSATKFLTKQLLDNFELEIHTLPEQQHIVDILGSLDDKVENNEKLASKLMTFIRNEYAIVLKNCNDSRQVNIGDICEVVGGGTPSTTNENYWNGDIVWLTPKDLSSDKDLYINGSLSQITEVGLKNSSARMLPTGSVLLSSRAPVGYLAISGVPLCTNQGFKSCVPNENIVNGEFLFCLILDNLEELKSLASGTTFAELSGSVLKKYKVLIPSLKSQEHFKKVTDPVFERIKYAQLENIHFKRLRELYLRKFFD